MKRLFFSLVIFAILLSACRPSVDVAKSNLWRETKPQVSDADLATLVSGNNTFALDLYGSLRKNDGNLVVSPYSVSAVFGMAYRGARGETASQLASAFHFDLPEDRLHPAFNALDFGLADATRVKLREMDKDLDPPQLNIVNTIWAQQGFPFQTPFLDTLGANYGAGVHLADFVGQPEAARENINAWVRKETKDKIEELIPENALGSDTSLVLVNALYFAADWSEHFDSTANASFYLQDGSRIVVPTMELGGECFLYAEGENWLAIELPYAGNTFVMDIIVPKAGEFEEFEKDLDYPLVSEIISSMQGAAVGLALPKFEFTGEFTLSDTLRDLGVSDAFEHGSADFSGMSENRNLSLDESFHKAYISVDEKGTCAAAATEAHFILISACMDGRPIPVQIDRPFIFIIRELKSGQILFIGRVLDPRQ
jgi:serpin B